MRSSDFEYALPPDLIAQRPANPRDSSRLMIFNRKTDQVEHRSFRDLPDYLQRGDALVINQTRVIPARIKGRKLPGGGSVEILLLKEINASMWETIVGGRGLNPGREIEIGEGILATIDADLGGSKRLVSFSSEITGLLDQIGEMPLPPYIHTPLQDKSEYQTTFATHPGSAAAPTAGLHFTPEMLFQLQAQEVQILRITLHVGLDTFAPVTEDDPSSHRIHTEWCNLDAAVAEKINAIKQLGGRVVAVGTTSVRTLESAALAGDGGDLTAFQGPTDLFILPGYSFKLVDAMLTNFHLPRSSLLMLVSAFIGRQRLLALYDDAIKRGYRFYSFGDAMLIL